MKKSLLFSLKENANLYFAKSYIRRLFHSILCMLNCEAKAISWLTSIKTGNGEKQLAFQQYPTTTYEAKYLIGFSVFQYVQK